jgi:hypothetical protein
MSTVESIWDWIRPPLEELKQDYSAEPDKPWEERRQFFLERLGLHDADENPVVEQLLQRLDEATEEERDRILGSDELDSMAYESVQQHGASQEVAGDEAYDEQAWQAYLAENGPQWDGTEESWEQFRQWFAYYADERGLSSPATVLLDYLTPQPAAERIATFAQYGVTITPTAEVGPGEAAAGYDEQAWQAYLAENGPQWDGTEESWEQFRQWFAYYADERGLSSPATALLDYLTPQPAAERIATFAQYGVTITSAGATVAHEPETAAAETTPSPEQMTEMIDDAIRAAIESTPGAEDLTDEDLAEIAAAVLAEVTGGDQ